MFVRLGDTKNPETYRMLLKNNLDENNKIKLFNIEIEEGKFEAFPIKYEDKEGFIYCVNKYDTYEFCTNDEVKNKKLKEELTIAKISNITYPFVLDIYEKSRNKNNEIEEFEIDFYNFKGYKMKEKSRKVDYQDKEGFIYRSKSFSNILAININNYNFIEKKDILDSRNLQKREILTFKEQKEIKEDELIDNAKKENELYKKKLKDRNIEITDYTDSDEYKKNGRYTVISLMNKLDNLENKFNDKIENKKVTMKELHKIINNKIDNNKYELLKKEFKEDYGFTVELEIDEKENLTIQLLGKNNKKLSTLKSNIFNFEDEYNFKLNDFESESIPVEYYSLDIDNDFECSDKELYVIENNQQKNVEDSKYNKFYELLNNKAFTTSEELQDVEEFENKHNIELEVYTINLKNSYQLLRLIDKELKTNPEVKKDLINLNKNNIKVKIK